ncbi:MAG TPA: hypothetical protein ENI53_01500 [Thermoplasmatales archaeon]|nr:hypothetical protein [Thermoplasmatales archaeon]
MNLDILVNTIIIILIICAILIFRNKITLKTIRKLRYPFLIFFITASVLTAAYYHNIEEAHDIDDAVTAACRHFIDGTNLYEENIVPRFAEKYHGKDTEIKYATFNYPPITLIGYSIPFIILFPIVGNFWFPLFNIILGAISFIVLSIAFPRFDKIFIASFIGMLTLFFLFDNIMLTLAFMSVAIYFYFSSPNKYNISFSILFVTLAAMVKMIGAITAAIFLLYIIQKNLKNHKVIKQVGISISAILILALITIAPFGITNILNSTVYYFSDIDIRSLSSECGGTLLMTLLLTIGKIQLFPIIMKITVGMIILGSLFISELLPRIFVSEIISSFVMIKASHALILIPAMTLFVYIIIKTYTDDSVIKMREEVRK